MSLGYEISKYLSERFRESQIRDMHYINKKMVDGWIQFPA